MATIRFPFRGPPFRFLAEHLAQDDDFKDDARLILSIDEATYLQLVTQLAETDEFLSRSGLISIVSKVLGGGEESKKIASIISRMGGIVHDADMDALEAMDVLGELIKDKTEGLKPDECETLIERLRKLVAEPIGIAKQYKASQLVDATGSELDDFQIICDIRPIFDPKRKRIEGAIPLTILRLEYNTPDSDTDVVEVRITEKQIEQFAKKIADAQLKLNMIKELLSSQSLQIPRTKSTVTKDKA